MRVAARVAAAWQAWLAAPGRGRARLIEDERGCDCRIGLHLGRESVDRGANAGWRHPTVCLRCQCLTRSRIRRRRKCGTRLARPGNQATGSGPEDFSVSDAMTSARRRC